MERTQVEDRRDTANSSDLVRSVLREASLWGVEEYCVCPGARNSPFVMCLENRGKVFYWPEERSAAFFALGRSRATGRPVAVITTSGTAVGELLPAVMEAAYSGVPLLLITADRPRRYRGTGAPQTCEQVGIFGVYATFSQDLAENEQCTLEGWDLLSPAHLNVCFDEPLVDKICTESFVPAKKTAIRVLGESRPLDHFLESVHRPLVLVSTLEARDREAVLSFLLELNAPVYAEAISGLREEPRLQHLRVFDVVEHDSVLRIGGVPTIRLWRELEESVLSISPLPFSGLSSGALIQTDLTLFFSTYCVKKRFVPIPSQEKSELSGEQLLIRRLSQRIPEGSLVYLGNSLPIRHWDAVAGMRRFEVFASRGLNGIDGQIATFLGLCRPDRENWAVIGDLTALYDLAAPWIIPQLEAKKIAICVVNNGGGQIFKKMFASEAFLHTHNLSFEPIAKFWGLEYGSLERPLEKPTLIELKP